MFSSILQPVVLVQPDTIIYFLFYKKTYIHIYNLYSILKTFKYDVLLVRQLYLVSHVLPSGQWVQTLPPHFLTFYADLIKWSDGLTRHSQQINMT
jgi:hypothetical protein